MRDGYDPSEGEDGASSGLDEFLCEYVDGTMDPVVRAAFEDYLRANPDLYEHVECLRRTRSMLCRYGCQLQAPAALQQRLRERLNEEFFGGPPVMPSVANRLRWIAGMSSVLLVLCGFLLAQHGAEFAAPNAPGTTIVTDSRSPHGYLVPYTASSVAPASSAGIHLLSRRPGVRSLRSEALPVQDSFLTSAQRFVAPAVVATLP